MRKLVAAIALLGAATVPALAAVPHRAAAPQAQLTAVPALPKVGHVWVVVLENKSYAQSFAPLSQAPYLHALAKRGALLKDYYATAHFSLPNYISMLSGQGPNIITQSDCQLYQDFVTVGPVQADGQFAGQGCVYPKQVPTLVDLMERKRLSWKGYMEDLAFSQDRQVLPCGTPRVDQLGRDQSQAATATDQYAARHNPFVYFRSVTDTPGRCARHITGMPALTRDLRSIATTPAFSFVTPNLCNDGHDTGCVGKDVAGDKTGNLTSVQHWLTRYVPQILASPAYKKDGLLLVTWDEAAAVSGSDGEADSSACCDEGALNTPDAGGASSDMTGLLSLSGKGGGRVGLLAVSPFIRPGTVSTRAYNHYSLLRTLSDLYGVKRLGYAGQATGVLSFGPDVFTRR